MKCLPLMIAALLAGCASKPLPPDWQANAKGALDASVDDYLKGHTAASNAEFREARAETTATGRPDHVAQVELVRCAAQVASLVFEDCPGYAALAPMRHRRSTPTPPIWRGSGMDWMWRCCPSSIGLL